MFLSSRITKKIALSIGIIGAFTTLTACKNENTQTKTVGIIVPIEHQAMTDIVSGVEAAIKQNTKQPVKFKVANAQGDINLQRAIIQQMKDEQVDVVAPIGTDATQMTIAMINKQLIVSIASSLSDQERYALKHCNVAVVHDEITAAQYLDVIHRAYPQITRAVLIHSASEKIYPEVNETVKAASSLGIQITPMMAQSLPDLTSVSQSIPKDTQAIFVLKDSLIVSGITTLEKASESLHIPLITSDQGSVENGAAIGIGVVEKNIGIEAGKLTSAILSGKNPCDLPIANMTHLNVFVNKQSIDKENVAIEPLQKTASELGFDFVNINKG